MQTMQITSTSSAISGQTQGGSSRHQRCRGGVSGEAYGTGSAIGGESSERPNRDNSASLPGPSRRRHPRGGVHDLLFGGGGAVKNADQAAGAHHADAVAQAQQLVHLAA